MNKEDLFIQKGPQYFRFLLFQTGNLYGQDTQNPITPTNVTMQPYYVNQSDFQQLKETNFIWAKLFIKMSQDFSTIQLLHGKNSDPMIRHLCDIAKKASQKKFQKMKAIFFRNDFIYDDNKKTFQQTQINLMSVGMFMISEKTQQFHQVLNQITDSNWRLYKEPSVDKVISFFVQLLNAYGKEFNQQKPCMLKVADGNGSCAVEQIAIQKKMMLRGYKIITMNFDRLSSRMSFNQQTGKLTVDGYEIGLVYYRNGYSQKHYINESCWKVRQTLECSRAIKVPNAQVQLVNFKSAQTLIQTTDIANKYLSEQEVKKIKKFQTKFWTPDQLKGNLQQIIKQNGENLVVKSIHEGSDQLYFYKQAHKVLREREPENYCVMELINSKPRPVMILKSGNQFRRYNAVTELCLYNTVIYCEKDIKEYKYLSYAARTYEENFGKGEVCYDERAVDSIAFK